jgi:hypothetical protein
MNIETILKLVEEQAKDEGLWFIPQTAPEAYLQQELRKLHAAIEGKIPEQCAREVLAKWAGPEIERLRAALNSIKYIARGNDAPAEEIEDTQRDLREIYKISDEAT